MSVFVLGSWVTGLSQTSSPPNLIEGQQTRELKSPESMANLGRREFAEIPALARSRASALLKQQSPSSSSARWTFIGPQPVANGHGLGAEGFCGEQSEIDVSGRVTAISFGALASSIYLGSANGGVWKSNDAGASWTPLTDSAVSMAVGALAV